MRVAIVGAGIAGLTCAQKLQQLGHDVTVFEKSAEPGGRMSTRLSELGGFDHGAQYFTASSERFRQEVEHWQSVGWIQPWSARLVTLDQGTVTPAGLSSSAVKPRMVAIPGMASLCSYLAQDIELRTEQAVTQLERYDDQWLLSVQCDTVQVKASAGPFDAVIAAMPPEPARRLLQSISAMAEQTEQTQIAPCWTLMLGFDQELGLNYDGAWVSNSRLAWIARDGSKPMRRAGEHWVAQASAEWSRKHLMDSHERVKEKLLKAFHEASDSRVQPVFAEAYCWRYAQAINPLPVDCLWDSQLRVGACGDWFAAGLDGRGRIENAYLSACAMAQLIA